MSEDDPWIHDIDTSTFEQEVVQRSRTTPVVVYFGAAWCGPCKTLGPALETRAREGAGRFVLTKIDIDRSPDLAQAFRVQAVPTVLAIANGQLVDGFQGVLPDEELDAFLEKLAPGGGAEPQGIAGEARQRAEAGDLDGAIELLRGHLRTEPDDAPARLALAEILLEANRAGDARRVFEKLAPGVQEGEEGRAISKRLAFADSAGDLPELEARVQARPDDAAARTALGRAYVAHNEYERGLDQLLEAVRANDSSPAGTAAREEARQAMLEVFDILGLEDPIANEYRFKLSLELFA